MLKYINYISKVFFFFLRNVGFDHTDLLSNPAESLTNCVPF